MRRYGDLAGNQSGKCVGGVPGDAPVDDMVVQPEAGDMCYGVGGLVSPCFAPTDIPTGARTLDADIDTMTSPLCSTTVSNTTACVIAAASITINAGVTVLVTGDRPLVLLATDTITVNGILDAASHRAPASVGPAGNFAGCDPGTAPTNQGGEGGGGAGGSFGTRGGNGSGPGATDGIAGATQTTTELRGGCPGQNGKEGSGGAGTIGIGGAGGGAVYLIADTSVSLGAGGRINASGAAGSTGAAPFDRAGGGGGGSGGMIGIDSPAIANAGHVFANGGGGGEGTGDNNPGNNGREPTTIAAAGPSGNGSNSGGDGGAGGAGMANGNNGGNSTGSGGGGGGGVGIIRVFRGALGGDVSPPAS